MSSETCSQYLNTYLFKGVKNYLKNWKNAKVGRQYFFYTSDKAIKPYMK